MTISNTFSNAVALSSDQSSNWVPEHEPLAHIITQASLGFLTLLGNEDIMTDAMFKKTNIKRIPSLIKSVQSNSMNPKVDQYVSLPMEFEANAAATSMTAGSDKSVTFVATGGMKKYDLLKNRTTGAVIIVISITSATVAVIQPFAGGTSTDGSDDIASGQKFDLTGAAYIDGATFGEGHVATPAQNDNYQQFTVDEYGVGILRKQLHLFPGETNQMEVNRLNARIAHNRKRELAFLFGVKAANTVVDTAATIYSMNGLTGLSTREVDAGGSLTMDELNKVIMPDIAQYGTGEFHAMCGNTPLAVFANIAKDFIRTTQQEQTLGNRIERIRTTLADIVLHGTDPMNNRTGEMLFFIPALLERKYLGNLNSVHLSDVSANNVMKDTGAYATCETLIPRNEDVIVTLTGVEA